MQETIEGTTILKFNKNILKRYEHNFKNGTMILYDVDKEETWFGNSSSRELIRLIDGKTSLNNIYIKLFPLYGDLDIDEVIESFNRIIEDLYDRNFIETADDEAI